MTIPEYYFALREDLKDNPEFLPTKAEPAATGWDVRCASTNHQPIIVKPGQTVKIPLGFRALIPEGWWMELRPRSSSFLKKSMHALYGVIDQDFPMEFLWVAKYMPEDMNAFNTLKIEFGDAVGQLIPIRRQEMIVTSISNEQIDRAYASRNGVRSGGFGSTDVALRKNIK